MLAGLWVGCSVDSSQTIHYRVNEPVFTSAETFRSSVRVVSEARSLSACGKIGFHNNHLYISDPGKGVHVIDNTDPAHPQSTGYVEVPGCQDFAIYDGRLYIDALIDLVWFDLTDPSHPTLQGRAENIFPDALPATGNEHSYDYELCQKGIAQGQIVTGWKLRERQQKYIPEYAYSSSGRNEDIVISTGNSNQTTSPSSRFSLYNNYLYAIVNNQINTLDLSADSPQKAEGTVHVGNVETTLLYRNKLFLGTPSGMKIYSIEEPQLPVYCSQISHVYGCNPMAIDNDLAYITVRSGNSCGQNTNELMIVDVSDSKQPQIHPSYTLKNPKGLSVHNGHLFLCDEGLKIFQIGQPESLLSSQIAHFKGANAYDVIPLTDTLFLIADNGLYQYNYADGGLRLVSVIPIRK